MSTTWRSSAPTGAIASGTTIQPIPRSFTDTEASRGRSSLSLFSSLLFFSFRLTFLHRVFLPGLEEEEKQGNVRDDASAGADVILGSDQPDVIYAGDGTVRSYSSFPLPLSLSSFQVFIYKATFSCWMLVEARNSIHTNRHRSFWPFSCMCVCFHHKLYSCRKGPRVRRRRQR